MWEWIPRSTRWVVPSMGTFATALTQLLVHFATEEDYQFMLLGFRPGSGWPQNSDLSRMFTYLLL